MSNYLHATRMISFAPATITATAITREFIHHRLFHPGSPWATRLTITEALPAGRCSRRTRLAEQLDERLCFSHTPIRVTAYIFFFFLFYSFTFLIGWFEHQTGAGDVAPILFPHRVGRSRLLTQTFFWFRYDRPRLACFLWNIFDFIT